MKEVELFMKELDYKFKQQRAVSISEIKDVFVKKYENLQSRKLGVVLGIGLATSVISTVFIVDLVDWYSFNDQESTGIVSIMSVIGGTFQIIIMLIITLGSIWGSYSVLREMLVLGSIDYEKSATDFELKILPARTMLENSSVFNMLGEISKTPILYKVVETGQYMLQPRVFAEHAMLRFFAQFFSALLIGTCALLIVPLVRGSDVAIYLMVTTLLWLSGELIHSLASLLATRHRLKNIVEKDPVGGCGELSISIKPHSFSEASARKINGSRNRAQNAVVPKTALPSSHSSSLDINVFERLFEAVNNFEHLKMVLIRLEWLSVETLKAFGESNKNDSAKLAQYRHIHSKNTKKMQLILEVFIPACLQELSIVIARSNSLYNFNNVAIDHKSVITKKDISEADLAVLMKIDEAAAKQGALVESIAKQYQDMSENSISSGFMQIINNQQKGWLDYDERGFSPKIQILETNLHKSIIPEIEAMMVGATPEQQETLRGKRIEVEGIIDALAQKDSNAN